MSGNDAQDIYATSEDATAALAKCKTREELNVVSKKVQATLVQSKKNAAMHKKAFEEARIVKILRTNEAGEVETEEVDILNAWIRERRTKGLVLELVKRMHGLSLIMKTMLETDFPLSALLDSVHDNPNMKEGVAGMSASLQQFVKDQEKIMPTKDTHESTEQAIRAMFEAVADANGVENLRREMNAMIEGRDAK